MAGKLTHTTVCLLQERVARQYATPKPRKAAMTERFLEEDLDEEPISDADDDELRGQLSRQRYVDQDEEVGQLLSASVQSLGASKARMHAAVIRAVWQLWAGFHD